MLKLDNNLLDELGLGSLPEDQKRAMLQHIYETLELRVGTNLANQMTDQQLDEFEKFIDEGGDANQAQALQWLETNLPNYKQVVNDVFEALKVEIKQMAPQLVTASTQAPAASQPEQPAATPGSDPYASQPAQTYANPAPAPSYQAPVPQQQAPAQNDYSQAPQQYTAPQAPVAPQQTAAPTPDPYAATQAPAQPWSMPQTPPQVPPVQPTGGYQPAPQSFQPPQPPQQPPRQP